MTNRNSPPPPKARKGVSEGAQGSFDCRREAPGGPRTGPQLQPELRPKAIPDHGPVRGPLDPDCRPEVGVPWPACRESEGGLRRPRRGAPRCGPEGRPSCCEMQPRAGTPTVQMAPAARERRPLASSPGGGRHARERETCPDDAGPCRRECRTALPVHDGATAHRSHHLGAAPFHDGGVCRTTRSWEFLPVGALWPARDQAGSRFH